MGEKSEVESRSGEVSSLLSRKNFKEALKVALTNPPTGSKDDSVKNLNAETVFKAVSSIPDSEIEKTVMSLHSSGNSDFCDNLVKYIYKGLAKGMYCGTMLKWHAVTVKVAGMGPIVRAMTDRKTV
mmetsp:Transcript_16757/g.29651  ORF Transcript_16757/g.29651 Transcript_16757/m.29651 type:complete len:126 (-) Transcript_16757:269-646(-)|eukprot:CAMPEP_0184526768 /NCGR_PEP_ID=MMETSP0198_2-20121128/10835_1 /TAXON_ID=1112570 /ORGANISM="Thraustochytrium sp., Strain LLF1b" /LENGTH=125 /DNA_ID=CAMNT_0026918371 /DNA_START=253 /DNA_END=630 /DNA_ORIENTATION=+